MQKKVKIKSNSIQNARKVTWMQKRVKIKYDSIKVKFSVLQNTMVVIWRKKIISSPTHQKNAMVIACMHREGVAAQAQLCLLFLCSTDDQVGFNDKVFAKHIPHRCGHSSHFLS